MCAFSHLLRVLVSISKWKANFCMPKFNKNNIIGLDLMFWIICSIILKTFLLDTLSKITILSRFFYLTTIVNINTECMCGKAICSLQNVACESQKFRHPCFRSTVPILESFQLLFFIAWKAIFVNIVFLLSNKKFRF